MRFRLFALLVLTSSISARAEQEPTPRRPRDREIISVGVLVGDARLREKRQTRTITLSVPAPPAPDDEDDEDDEPPRPRHAVARFNLNAAVVEPENFDRWVFAEEPSERARLRHLEDVLRARIEAVARKQELTESQRAKLRIAGKGDIKRFFDRVEERRTAFEKERQTFRTGLAALRRLEELERIYREGPFGEGSLFVKTLRKIGDERMAGRGSD